jgi:hypothetical protein
MGKTIIHYLQPLRRLPFVGLLLKVAGVLWRILKQPAKIFELDVRADSGFNMKMASASS